MAKNKQFEIEYKAERLRRTKVRKADRKVRQVVNRDRYGRRCRCCGQQLGCDNDY